MNVLQVYYRLYGEKTNRIRKENDLRRQCFYTIAPHWNNKSGKLKHLWQLWAIPEIDNVIADEIGYARIRPWSEEVAKELGLTFDLWMDTELK
jgi:hypothetical protein